MFSHELPSLAKTNMKSKSSENVNGLSIKNRTHTQYLKGVARGGPGVHVNPPPPL